MFKDVGQIIVVAVYNGKIITGKKLERLKEEFTNRYSVNGVMALAAQSTTPGMVSYLYVHNDSEVIEIHLDAKEPRYEMDLGE